jgi:hypothetical protein
MFTRRELLASVAAAPLVEVLPARCQGERPGIRFYEEAHALAEESARGFRLLCGVSSTAGSPSVIIAPAVRDIRPGACAALLEHVRRGAWLLFESGVCFSSNQECFQQARTLKQTFGLDVLPPLRTANLPQVAGTYVNYAKPAAKMVRSFHAVTPIRCPHSETVARFHEHAVCSIRAIGKGGVIYLGSMLGPGLLAEEREAREVGDGLIGWLNQTT